MISYSDAIKKRKSIRNYDKRHLEDNLILKIDKLISNPLIGPFGNKPRFTLIEKPAARKQEKVRLGTYGFISNAAYFIGGCIEKSEFSEVDYGYSLERIVIELTRLDLGTCWIGGTFKRSDYRTILNTSEKETIPCITPVGYPAKRKTLRERLGLTLTNGGFRQDFSSLFFENDFQRPLLFNAEDKINQALEAVRLAPSAVNKQPWRVVKQDNKYHFFILRDKLVGKTKSTDLQKVDLGIALAHFKLILEENFIEGKWHIANPGIPETEYLITWVQN